MNMKRYAISYDIYGAIYSINVYKNVPEMNDVHKKESGLCLVSATNINEALKKYKSMTGNEII
jgi:hypothetical protein